MLKKMPALFIWAKFPLQPTLPAECDIDSACIGQLTASIIIMLVACEIDISYWLALTL